MRKNILISLLIQLLLPYSLFTMDTDHTSLIIPDYKAPEENKDNRSDSPTSLSCSELVAVIDQLDPEKIEKVIDKLSQKCSDLSATDTKQGNDPLLQSKSIKPTLPPKKKPSVEKPQVKEGMPTYTDAILAKIVSNARTTIKLLRDGTYDPQNTTHSVALENAINEAIAQEDMQTILDIASLCKTYKKCENHDSIPDTTGFALFTYLQQRHELQIEQSNTIISKATQRNCDDFNRATLAFTKAIAQLCSEYQNSITQLCNPLDEVVSQQQKALEIARAELQLIQSLNKSTMGNFAILLKKGIQIPAKNPGLSQFEQNKWRLDSMQKTSLIPTIMISNPEQQLALSDK